VSTKKKPDGSDLDASTFDLDAWIDGVVRPEVTVELYPDAARYRAVVALIEAQIPDAEKTKPEDRGLDDPSPEALLAQLAELKAERAASVLPVRVSQLTQKELRDVTLACREAHGPDADDYVWAWVVSASCVEPTFTPEQILKLHSASASGEAMTEQLAAAVNLLRAGLTAPFSRAPSGDSPA
jgi:hypothetical protein